MSTLGLLTLSHPLTRAQGQPDDDILLFETHIRPVLAEKCWSCHGPKKQKGNLRLDSADAFQKGGQSGPPAETGKEGHSLLWIAISQTDSDLKMPPKGAPLTENELAAFKEWLKRGAPWPAPTSTPPSSSHSTDSPDSIWWSFRPLQVPPLPQTENPAWCRNEIDPFILAKMNAAQVQPAPETDRLTFLRRLSFDLLGLPPTQQESEHFLNDASPRAYENLVDRMLADSRYGERWARHWLDLVRYGESDGYRQDAYRPHTWRYRDWVIQAFNSNKPYDHFILEQLAGDEIAPNDPNVLVATGYLRQWIYEYNQRDVVTQWNEIINDVTDVTSDVFMGISLRCARCHDHKFDPLPQKDYYRLRAFFEPLLPRDDLPLATSTQWLVYQKQHREWEKQTQNLRQQIETIEAPHREAATQDILSKFIPEIQAMVLKASSDRSPYEHQIAELARRQVIYDQQNSTGRIKKEEKTRWENLKAQLKEFPLPEPKPLPTAFAVSDVGPFPPPTYIPGDRRKKIIEPGFLSLLSPGPAEITPVPSAPNSTGRRTALAQWLTDPSNPLTARVWVNRVWQYHFGRGLVATPSDFGTLGAQPTHPMLLDWLAYQFIQDGWDIKKLHRRIVLSATYRQSSILSPQTQERDPDNELWSRMQIRRLEAEPIRDALLAVSGELNPDMGGPSVDPSKARRSIYTKIIRNQPDPLLKSFDAADGFNTTSRRDVTTTPPQALLMLNGEWVWERAQAFAKALHQALPEASSPSKIEWAYRSALGRSPETNEVVSALQFIEQQSQTESSTPDTAGWNDFCHALLNSNEFLYLD